MPSSAGSTDHDSLTPDEAFSILGNETRMQILQELGKADRSLSFTDLRDRVGRGRSHPRRPGRGDGVRGIRRVIHTHPHEHGDHTHRHPHLHLLPGQADHEHEHGARDLLKTGVVGALFTLSPPLSMIAFSATLFPTFGPSAVALAVVVYAGAITATMGLLGAGVGVAVGLLDGVGNRAYAVCQVLAGFGLAALSISVLSGGLGGLL